MAEFYDLAASSHNANDELTIREFNALVKECSDIIRSLKGDEEELTHKVRQGRIILYENILELCIKDEVCQRS